MGSKTSSGTTTSHSSHLSCAWYDGASPTAVPGLSLQRRLVAEQHSLGRGTSKDMKRGSAALASAGQGGLGAGVDLNWSTDQEALRLELRGWQPGFRGECGVLVASRASPPRRQAVVVALLPGHLDPEA